MKSISTQNVHADLELMISQCQVTFVIMINLKIAVHSCWVMIINCLKELSNDQWKIILILLEIAFLMCLRLKLSLYLFYEVY